ncbi:MAG: M48 family metalloprotease [Proteobacteria bacterium]|jgi:predicted Zn-dependent protease|nr:M48 family metalloprotease [Pseudomonadota bacterium]
MRPTRLSRLLCIWSVLLIGACASVTNPVTGERELTVMDERAEIAAGAKAHQEILKEYALVDNAALQLYVDGVGQKLAAQSQRANLKWTFTVLDTPEVNAFALPGGYVYVTRGLLAYLDNEAELAGVVGHEIGHVTARHGAQRATSQARAGWAVLGATVLGAVVEGVTGMRGVTQAASELAQSGAAGLIARYGREQELQADQLGADYLSRLHYDPQRMVDVIQVLKDQERYAADAAKAAGRAPPAAPDWLASHPSNDERLARIRETAARLKATQPGGGWADDGRMRFLRTIDGITFGDGREQGVVRGRQFLHEPLGIAITAPEGWRIQNDTSQVALVNAAGDAALVLRVLPAQLLRQTGNDHQAILRQALGATEGRTERLTLGGNLSATYYNGQRRDADGTVSALEATIVNGPAGRVFLLAHLGADAAARERARAAMRQAELSFRALGAADGALARPWRLGLVPYPAGGFAQLARSAPLTELAEQQLRLLNGVYGGRPLPKPAELVKTVQ